MEQNIQQENEAASVSPEEAALDKAIELMEKPINFYMSERRPDEIDLVQQVREKMICAGLGDKLPECFDSNRFIQEAMGRPAHAQQYNLTRYFTVQLMASPSDTSIERYALMYEVRPDQWLDIFDKTILPTIANHGLPIKL